MGNKIKSKLNKTYIPKSFSIPITFPDKPSFLKRVWNRIFRKTINITIKEDENYGTYKYLKNWFDKIREDNGTND